MTNSITVKLSEPLMTHKGEVRELDLKEPKGRSFVAHGEPFSVHPKGESVNVEYNNESMMKFLADMCGIDSVILGNMTASDYRAARDAATLIIMGLVGDRPSQP